MKIRILTGDEVRQALPMPAAIAAMWSAFGQFSAGQAKVPLRSRLNMENGVLLLMPAYMQASSDLAVKLVTVFGDNPELGLPRVSATVLVLDARTGRLKALMEGDSLTALRTGAGGGLAADLLARQDARRVVLFGAGVQGRAQLQAVMAVRRVTEVTLVEHTSRDAHDLAAQVESWPQAPQVSVVKDPRNALQNADIVLAATTSRTPLFDGALLRPGTHVSGVGSFAPDMQEIDAVTVSRARVVVDSRQGCLAEAGDLIAANARIDAELGEIVNGTAPGRLDDEEITFFKSVGMAAQDAVAAAAVLDEAEKQGLGILVDL
jgi:ornithine cyclodeaminase/alanine dehydrogenase-like protein (mu-crystallin family)